MAPMPVRLRAVWSPRLLASLFALVFLAACAAAQAPTAPDVAPASNATEPHTVLRTTVRRVVLDVVVTDSSGTPVSGLTRNDFQILEDGKPQTILSFDPTGFTNAMDYVPPALPPQPANTFMNLPSTPERGPLYVLLYDLVDLDDPSQMDTPEDHHQQVIARQQMMKFIENKPEGTRFAIFARSDGLHLIQGFTADKTLLVAALDPHHPRPHLPMVFLMGSNFGRGNRLGALDTLHRIALYLDGLPGRKNLIWFSSMFPLSLFAEQNDGPNFQEETRATLDLMAHNQIAIYPVDARGVAAEDSHVSIGTGVHNDTVTSSVDGGAPASSGGGSAASSQAGSSVQGDSAVVGSFNVMDEIARETGGQAFYGTNDVAKELTEATEGGSTFYTLSYAPTDRNYNGNLRHIQVELAKKGYHLAYRRSYYGTELAGEPGASATVGPATSAKRETTPPPVVDTLSANMQHGAPTAHQLVFVVQAKAVGAPTQGTPEQMAQLATEPAYFKLRHRAAAGKPLTPVALQHAVFAFEIPTRQFKSESQLDLEVAAAAYDSDGQLMNAVVRLAKKEVESSTASGQTPRFYRVEQALELPAGAVSVRFAIRDASNDRTGAVEVPLPLAGQSPTPSTSAAP